MVYDTQNYGFMDFVHRPESVNRLLEQCPSETNNNSSLCPASGILNTTAIPSISTSLQVEDLLPCSKACH
jgi:hypothetical protein